jgi:hypothetical protein
VSDTSNDLPIPANVPSEADPFRERDAQRNEAVLKTVTSDLPPGEPCLLLAHDLAAALAIGDARRAFEAAAALSEAASVVLDILDRSDEFRSAVRAARVRVGLERER